MEFKTKEYPKGDEIVMETTRWSFNDIAELDRLLADFKAKANISE